MQLRKLVHLSGAVFPAIAWFSPFLAIMAITAGVVAFIAMEAIKHSPAAAWTSLLYRDGENDGIAYEPLLYLLSIASLLVVSVFFLPPACYAAIVVLTIGDGVAGMVGKAVGKHRLPGSNKTLEGTAAGLIAASAAGFLFAGPLAIAGAAAGMAVEAYARRFENVSVAASAFIVMAVLTLLF